MRGLIVDDGFWVALAFGVLSVAGCWLVRGGTALSLRGTAAAVAVLATFVGFRIEHRLPASLVAAMVLLVLGEWLGESIKQRWARPAFLVPGAVVAGTALPVALPAWMVLAAIAVTVFATPLVLEAARQDPRTVVVALLVSAAGVYVCTPDTEHAKAMLGGFAAASLFALSPRLRGSRGMSAVVGLFAWTATLDGRGRPGAVVGALACLGVVVLMPLMSWARGLGKWHPIVPILVQVVLVAYLSRLAGYRDSGPAAVGLAAPAIVAACAVLAFTACRDE